MKTNIYIAFFFISCLFMACEKNKNTKDDISINDIKYTECIPSIDIAESDISLEYIDNYLYVTHKNAMVNCGFIKVDVTFTIENNTIVVTEQEVEDGTYNDCVCSTNISYTLGAIESGEYTIIIKLREQVVYYNEIKIF